MRRRVHQSGIQNARVVGRYPAFSKAMTAECVVIAVRYIDDERNTSKQYTEYDVKDLRTGQIYNNVRRVDSIAGMDDGEENVLRPAQRLIGAASTVFDPKIAQLSQSDGDRVSVSFSYGAQYTPIITDVLPHPKMAYGTKREQGQRRFQTHKGTSVETKADGTHQIKRNDTTITLNADETIEVVHKSGASLRFNDQGDIIMKPAKGRDIFHGKEGATENHVLGQQLKAILGLMMDIIAVHNHSTAVGPSSPMLTGATLTAMKSTLDLMLSQMAFVSPEV